MNYSSVNCEDCKFDCSNHKSLNKIEQQALTGAKRNIVYKKGETIFKQSTYISHIVYIRSGLIKVLTEGYNNKNIILNFVGKGQYLGLPFLFNDNYSYYTATAIKDVELCLIEKKIFANLVLSNKELNKQILNIISLDANVLYNKISSLGTKQLHGRLAAAILALSETKCSEDNIFAYLTKKELAEYAGMSIESVMRLLNELKSDRIIIQKAKKIVINDYNLLVKLSQIG